MDITGYLLTNFRVYTPVIPRLYPGDLILKLESGAFMTRRDRQADGYSKALWLF